jgi:hypothetical protein
VKTDPSNAITRAGNQRDIISMHNVLRGKFHILGFIPSVQNYETFFDLSKYIAFIIYLDIASLSKYNSKSYVSKKDKTS